MRIHTVDQILFSFALCTTAFGQEAGAPEVQPTAAATPKQTDTVDKRIFGVLPNYRTANESATYEPITVKQKFHIGLKDSTDYPIFLLSAAFAGLYQLEDSHPSYGQGMAGYAKRYGATMADLTIGNMMTESIMPSLLHEDPRYFRRGTGSIGSRVAYSATRIFVTRTDSGGTRFNNSEVFGNALAAVAGNAYYPQERSVADNFNRLGVALATDAVSQILKEFWPDIKQKWLQKKQHH